MAEENLGTAVLRIEVDIPSLEKDLSKARSLIEKQKPVNFRLDIGSSQQQFRKLETSAKTLEQQFQKLLATPLNLNSKNLEKLGADALKAGTAINNYTRQVINGEAPLANSIASLQQQGLAFRTLAANVKVGTAEFTNFTQAAAKASQKELFAGFQQAAAAQKLFASGGGGGVDTFKGTEQLLAYSRSIAQTPAAIQLYITALQQALNVTTTADSNFGRLSAEIEKQAAALDRAANSASRYNQIFNLAGQPKALPPGRGPSQFVFSAEETPEERRTRERAERRAGKIQGIQTYASTGGADPLAGFGQLFTKPNPEAVRAEEELRKARVKTAEQTLKAAADERKAVEATRKAASRKQQDIISNALIGGAFPLLFGQGIGASIGGAAGGAAGGAIGGQFGFGLSLVGTALGTQVDIAVQKLGTLAKALDDPIANFDTLIQNASLSSKEVERYGKSLIESGRNAEAAALIQSDLLNTFGSLQGAKDYNDAVDTISRSFSQATTVLASFVAGPLAALIRTLSQPTGGLATGVSFEQLVGQLDPQQYRQVQAAREQATEASRASRGGVSAFLPPSNEDVNKGLQAGIQLAQKLLDIEKQRAELAARIASAQVQNQKSLSDSYKLIDASTQGYERQSLELQKQQVPNERNRKLLELTDKERNDPANPKAVKIQQDSALEIYRITQQLNQLDKDRAAQKGLEAAQDKLKLQSIGEQITATQALGKAERGVARETLASTQAIQQGINEAKRREQEIGAQIDAARQRGGDAGEQEASRLVGQQKIAANETRLELEKGALALKEAGEQLRDNLRNAIVDFTRIRSDPEGLNKFLSPQQQDERARQDFQLLLPQFREAQGRFTQLTGAQAPVFTGPTAGVNDAIRDFIQRTQAEGQAGKDLAGTQQALATNLEAYNNTITQLAAVTKTLAEKNWAVNVAVSGAQAAAYGDVVNGAVSP